MFYFPSVTDFRVPIASLKVSLLPLPYFRRLGSIRNINLARAYFTC